MYGGRGLSGDKGTAKDRTGEDGGEDRGEMPSNTGATASIAEAGDNDGPDGTGTRSGATPTERDAELKEDSTEETSTSERTRTTSTEV